MKNEFNQIYAYYFDIPFDEILNRHKQKPNAHEFTEEDMKRWWNEKDYLDCIKEISLYKDMNLEDIVERIYQDVIKIK